MLRRRIRAGCGQFQFRYEAQKLAAAAGRSVGPIVAVSDGSGVARVGDFAFVSTPYGSLSEILAGTVLSLPPATCTMTVRFSLGN